MGSLKAEQVARIIVHHSASDRDTTTPADIYRWHKERGWRDIGYQYIITGDGALHFGRPETMTGAHTKGHNRTSIGVCVTGNFEKSKPTPKQWRMLCLFLERTMQKYRLERANVHYHKEFSATACCGKNLISMVENWRAPKSS
jgi:N-acetylmuramoyl-L-alanine amidase